MGSTVMQYVLSRLRALGITEIFGVPGDYAFPIEDAIAADPGLLSYPDTTCPGMHANRWLWPLQDNGGPTMTMELDPASPAIDAAMARYCQLDLVNGLDQRGVTRPQGTACDIGALEYVPNPRPSARWSIDINPGSDPNSINCRNANGVITVAILSTPGHDATAVDHRTVTFEGRARSTWIRRPANRSSTRKTSTATGRSTWCSISAWGTPA